MRAVAADRVAVPSPVRRPRRGDTRSRSTLRRVRVRGVRVAVCGPGGGSRAPAAVSAATRFFLPFYTHPHTPTHAYTQAAVRQTLSAGFRRISSEAFVTRRRRDDRILICEERRRPTRRTLSLKRRYYLILMNLWHSPRRRLPVAPHACARDRRRSFVAPPGPRRRATPRARPRESTGTTPRGGPPRANSWSRAGAPPLHGGVGRARLSTRRALLSEWRTELPVVDDAMGAERHEDRREGAPPP